MTSILYMAKLLSGKFFTVRVENGYSQGGSMLVDC